MPVPRPPSPQPRALAPTRCPAHGSGPAPVPLACPPPRQLTLRSPTPQTQDGKTANMGGGYFSTDASVNPQMHNWNAVFLRYCDGGSFSGSNATVTNYGGDPTKPLWFRGKHVLKADMNDLLANRGLAKATDVVVSGCSAGEPRCRWLVAALLCLPAPLLCRPMLLTSAADAVPHPPHPLHRRWPGDLPPRGPLGGCSKGGGPRR